MEPLSPADYTGLSDATTELAFLLPATAIIVPDGQPDLLLRPGTPVGRLFYGAGKQAFRAGGVTTAAWNDQLVGRFSFAGGLDTQASGEGAVAAGHATVASGPYAVALGLDTQATGYFAVATGAFNQATGAGSFAAGANNVASGDYASAFGRGTVAAGQAEFAVGQYNTVPTTLAGNRAFVVGTGQGPEARADGFTVFQDGTVGLHDLAKAPAQPAGRLYSVEGQLHFDGVSLEGKTDVFTKVVQYDPKGKQLVISSEGFSQAAITLGMSSALENGPDKYRLLLQPVREALHVGLFPDHSYQSGEGSIALGSTPEASGKFTVALGHSPQATAKGAIAVGTDCTAGARRTQEDLQREYSFLSRVYSAFGEELGGYSSWLLSNPDTLYYGHYSLAVGYQCRATREGAVALGVGCTAGSSDDQPRENEATQLPPYQEPRYDISGKKKCLLPKNELFNVE